MKATIEVPDDLYRKVKAKSALEGRPVREVTERLFRKWLAEPEGESSGKRTRDPDGQSMPPWFGALRAYAKNARGRHDMRTIRHSIARARGAGAATERDDGE